MRQQAEGRAKGEEGAIFDQAAARGGGTSTGGQTAALQMQAAQGAAQRANSGGMQLAGQAANRAYQAQIMAGQYDSQLRSQNVQNAEGIHNFNNSVLGMANPVFQNQQNVSDSQYAAAQKAAGGLTNYGLGQHAQDQQQTNLRDQQGLADANRAYQNARSNINPGGWQPAPGAAPAAPSRNPYSTTDISGYV